jgi:RNA polymerase sigma factor (sigma-70 family)
MRYSLATNHQLQTIISSDNTIPTDLLVGVVEEVINRGTLDKFIADAIYSVVGRRQSSKRFDFEDLMQMGRNELYLAAKKYESGRGKKFTSFAYTVIRQEIMRQFHYWTMQKRDDSDVIHYDAFDSNWDAVDHYTRVEPYVVNKLFYQQMMNLKSLSEPQKEVIKLRLSGKSLREIGDLLGIKDVKTVSGIYQRGLTKIKRVAIA